MLLGVAHQDQVGLVGPGGLEDVERDVAGRVPLDGVVDVAVVIGGEDAAGALSEATSLVTGGPLSVLGYALLRFVVLGVAVAAPLLLAVAVAGVGVAEDTTALLVPAVLLMLVAFPLGVALGFAYHVAYYRERRPGVADPASDAGGGNADVVSPPSADD